MNDVRSESGLPRVRDSSGGVISFADKTITNSPTPLARVIGKAAGTRPKRKKLPAALCYYLKTFAVENASICINHFEIGSIVGYDCI